MDDQGNVYNINADTAASRIAGTLKAESLISMTDIAGLLEDKDDPSTLIPVVYVSEVGDLVRVEHGAHLGDAAAVRGDARDAAVHAVEVEVVVPEDDGRS